MSEEPQEAAPQPEQEVPREPEVRPRRSSVEPPDDRGWPLWPVFAGAGVAAAALVALLLSSGVVETPAPRCQSIRRISPATEGQELVLVAGFDGAGGRDVASDIRRDIAGRPGPDVAQVCDVPVTSEEARTLGEQVNAAIVVWGTVAGEGVTANVELLRQPDTIMKEAAFRVPARLPDSYSLMLSDAVRAEAPFVGGFVSGYAAGLNFDLDRARAELEGALGSQPEGTTSSDQGRLDMNAAQAHFALGTLRLLLSDDAGAAIESFDWATRLDPDKADAAYNRGVARYLQGDDEAIGEFSQAIDLSPTDAAAYNGRGVAHLEAGDTEAALADFERAIASDEAYAPAYYNRGRLRAETGDLAAAVSDFTAAIERDTAFAPAYKERGTAYLALEDPDAALADYQVALALEPAYEQAYVQRGHAYFEVGAYHNAIDDFNRALQAQPNDLDTIFSRGQTYIQVGDYLAAISDLTTVLAQQPENADAYLLRANAFFERRNYAAAEADFNAALELMPGDGEAYFVRARARTSLGDFDGALADFERAVDEGYDEADLYLERADVFFFDLGQPVAALDDYEAALDRDPRLEGAQHGLALALIELERYEEAQAAWSRLLDINAFEGEHHAGLAVALDAQGLRDEAIERYLRALSMNASLIRMETLRDLHGWQANGLALAAELIEAVIAELTERQLQQFEAQAAEAEADAQATAQAPPPTAVPVEETPEPGS